MARERGRILMAVAMKEEHENEREGGRERGREGEMTLLMLTVVSSSPTAVRAG